jgi:hypothetical protein
MQKIQPFKRTEDAVGALDNGGRFYNFGSKANDGEISTAEVAKVAGLFNSRQNTILHYAMSTALLDASETARLEAMFSDDLQSAFRQYQPQFLLPSEAHNKGKLSCSAILTGTAVKKSTQTEFKGFVMVPIMTGKVMVMSLIPMLDQYDVYELHDDGQSETFLIAHSRGSAVLPAGKIRIGGILKELKAKDNAEGEVPEKFLEALYYSEL